MDDSRYLTLGIDLGGTKVKTALVDRDGGIISTHRHPTLSETGPEKVISRIEDCIRLCLDKASAKASSIGIGVAGQVDGKTGVVRFAPNLGWRNVPLREELERRFNLPVVVTNDVRAAMLGEWWYGAGKGINDLICIFAGTGVGGGIISGGRIIKGCTNTAGEIGHMTVVVDGRPCRCRNRGCLEAYAGGWAIAERAQELVRENTKRGEMLIEIAGSIENISAATVGEGYKKGDALSTEIVEDTGRYLAAGLVGLINALNPCMIILGGGVIESLPVLISIVEGHVNRYALESAIQSIRLVKSRLKDDAGVVGAAALAKRIFTQEEL